MPNVYPHNFSSWLKNEFDRLESGNTAEKQRLRNAYNAIAKVLSNPLNTDFNKDLPGNYKAVDVLQQYRLFFRLEVDHLLKNQVVFFVWINDEESLHRTGKPDDCYKVFREMVAKSEVEVYQPDPSHTDQYLQHGSWGSDYIYISYSKTVLSTPPENLFANTGLHLSKISEKEYNLQAISVSTENKGLASSLLQKLCLEADKAKIRLAHELFIKSENAEKSRHLLKKNQFTLIELIDDIEIWQRT